MSKRILPKTPLEFYSILFSFRSLIHFEFIFVYGVTECSNFTLLHVVVQFSQYHLLNEQKFTQSSQSPLLPL